MYRQVIPFSFPTNFRISIECIRQFDNYYFYNCYLTRPLKQWEEYYKKLLTEDKADFNVDDGIQPKEF